MPIPFSLIPENLQLSIVQKQDVEDYVNFAQCSRESHNIASQVTTKFVKNGETLLIKYFNRNVVEFNIKHPAKTIYVDLHSCPIGIAANHIKIQTSLSQRLCKKLTKFVKRTGSSFGHLHISKAKCTPDQFKVLLEEANVKGVTFHGCVSPKFLNLPAVQKLHSLYGSVTLFNSNKGAILSRKAPKMVLPYTMVFNKMIVTLINEWMNGDREIEHIVFRSWTSPWLRSLTIYNKLSFWDLKCAFYRGKKLVIERRQDKEQITVDFSDKYVYIYCSSNEDSFKRKHPVIYQPFCVMSSILFYCVYYVLYFIRDDLVAFVMANFFGNIFRN